ncbi:TetR family transcriptional regulator [Antrihabitans stalactiti]|uniref:TetR/AcrR family transcriptional regulator n=1 Tax=Antrihabitans stalactiti TaxID=2584121 RepID=A0A848KB95_9NOCA|nr:TetR/AcrR family transcriptional regulator [Antrihabitans stalactiti]
MRSRRKILDATLELIGSVGFDGVNIASAAQAAGVSRQTVYANFGSREELVSQAMSGVTIEVLGRINERLESTTTPVEYVIELIVEGRSAVRANPVLATLLNAGRGNPLFDTDMMARAKPVARELLSPLVARDSSIESKLEDLIEVSLRLGLSVILFDDEAVHTDDDLRRFLTRWLEPAMRKT